MLRLTFIAIILNVCLAVDFEIINKEAGPIWVGTQTNDNQPPLVNGGFILQQGATRIVQAPDNWGGRFWARTWCDGNSKHCLTGDCGNKVGCGGNGGAPPATLAEIRLKGHGGLDYYDVSLVDGFNIPVVFEPVGGQGDGGQYSCKPASCSHHINEDCPEPLQLKTEHGVIGCKSACVAFNTDEYCCRGAHDKPETCKDTDWPVDYPAYFRKSCPGAYSYAYDDKKSTFTCKAQKYKITFGG